MWSRVVGPLSRLVAWGRPPDDERGAGRHERSGAWAARRRYHRTLFLVIGCWSALTCLAAAFFPAVAIVIAVAGLAHVVVAYRVEQRRRADRAGEVGGTPRR